MEKCYRGLRILFCVCCAAAVACLLALNGYALAILAAALLWVWLSRKPLPHFTLTLFIVGILSRLVILFVLKPTIVSDFALIYNTAQAVLQGQTIPSLRPDYFSLWAYQSAPVLWDAFWLLLWNDPMCLKLVNILLSAGLICLLYRMARQWVSRSAAQIAAMLLALFPFVLTFHTVLSNQIPSAFFLTLGLWVLVCGDCDRLGFWRFPLAGLALQLGTLLRSDGIVVLVAVLAWAVFECFRHPEAARRTLTGLLALLAVCFLVARGADIAVKASGLNPYGLANNNLLWKFVLGLNHDTTGSYSPIDEEIVFSTLGPDNLPTEETMAIQKALIQERLSAGPRELLKLALLKCRVLWSNDALYWAWNNAPLQDIKAGPVGGATLLFYTVQQFDRGLFSLAVVLMLYGLCGKRWKEYPTSTYLPFFVFFAAFCALLLIEVQSHYAYLPQLYIFTAAAFGLDRLVLRSQGTAGCSSQMPAGQQEEPDSKREEIRQK